jgi:hypothetical protein
MLQSQEGQRASSLRCWQWQYDGRGGDSVPPTAVKKGVVVVRSSRVPTGLVGRNVEITTTRMDSSRRMS